MTATPRILSSKVKTMAEQKDLEVSSMDDETQYGSCLHRLSFSSAIKRDLLTPYKVVVIGVDDAQIEQMIVQRDLVSMEQLQLIDSESLGNHIALAKAIKKYSLRRLITFHGTVDSAKLFSEQHKEVNQYLSNESKSDNELVATHISGEMNARSRAIKLQGLREISPNQTGFLSNARCLSEGVDVPSLDGIMFVDPKRSQIDIIQSIGRAIRRSPDKKEGVIILPVYLGDLDNVEDKVVASRFNDIWKVILALKSQDDSLSELIDNYRLALGSRNAVMSIPDQIGNIYFDLPQRIGKEFEKALRVIMIRSSSDDWLEMLGRYEALDEEPKRGTKEFSWAHNQRTLYNRNLLRADRVQILKDRYFIFE